MIFSKGPDRPSLHFVKITLQNAGWQGKETGETGREGVEFISENGGGAAMLSAFFCKFP